MTFDEMLEEELRRAHPNKKADEVNFYKHAIARILAEALIVNTPPPRFRADLLVRQKGE